MYNTARYSCEVDHSCEDDERGNPSSLGISSSQVARYRLYPILILRVQRSIVIDQVDSARPVTLRPVRVESVVILEAFHRATRAGALANSALDTKAIWTQREAVRCAHQAGTATVIAIATGSLGSFEDVPVPGSYRPSNSCAIISRYHDESSPPGYRHLSRAHTWQVVPWEPMMRRTVSCCCTLIS